MWYTLEKRKNRFNGLLISIFAWILLLSTISLAISVDTPIVNPTTVNPGDSFTVKANVTESSGREYIYNTNMSCVGSGGTEWTDSWDSYKILNNSLTWTVINTTTIEASGTFTLNTSSINGTWTCKVYGNNTTAYSAVGSVNQPTVNTRVGIIISESNCEFASNYPGSNNSAWDCGGNAYDRYTHDGNIDINVTINGTNLIGEIDSGWIILVGNITYKNVTAGDPPPSPPGTSLTTTATDIVTVWNRGTYPTKSAIDLYAWLNYPTPLKSQTYQGTVTLSSVASS